MKTSLRSPFARPARSLVAAFSLACGGAAWAGWYMGEMHCHLAINGDDGQFASVEAAVNAYKAAGYHFLSITGHNVIHDSAAYNVDGTFVTIPGVELHNYSGTWAVDNPGYSHVNSIGCTTPAGPVDTAACRTMQDQIDLALSMGGIAQINHPLWNPGWHPGSDGVVTTERILATRGAALLEIRNSNWRTVWDQVLSSGRQIYGTFTIDNHNASVGTPYLVVVEAESLTRPAILAALRAGRFYSQMNRPASLPPLISSITRSGRTLTISHIGDNVTFYGKDYTQLASSAASPASYTLPAGELFVRARVSLSNSHWAFTQAYFPPPEIQTPELRADGTAVIRWTSQINRRYTLHHTTDLAEGFTVLQAGIPATPPMNSYTDTFRGMNRKFWKVSTEE